MQRMFATLDELLIERMFQPLCDLMMQRLGLTRCAAACFCIDIALLGWIMARAPGLSDAMAALNAGAMASDLAILLLGLVALIALRIMFQRVASLHRVNPLRLSMRPHRAIILLLLMSRLTQRLSPSLGDAADVAMLLFAATALYLGACASRPPLRRPSTLQATAAAS